MSSGILKELEALDKRIKSVTSEKTKLERLLVNLNKQKSELKVQYNIKLNGEQDNWNSWSIEKYPWSEKINDLLKNRFHLPKFRLQQLAAINATMSKKDVLILMPTGGGKSLCYQLPALVGGGGMTLVISPLLSLMEDQVLKLKSLKINAVKMSSSESNEVKKSAFDYMNKKIGEPIKLMYVTPEWLAKSKRFMSALQKCYEAGRLDRIAIDEVHCCSQWGHDFRPDYKYLGLLKGMFPNVPILGLTATATTAVLLDIQEMIDIPGCVIIKAPFDRPNLRFKVVAKPEKLQDCLSLLENLLSNKYKNESGIIYTATIKASEEVSNGLRKSGLRVRTYHAELDKDRRQATHEKWLNNEYQVVVATVAFGMGIDKSDVRFVIHYSIPKSMEALYQESGRAGRDGERADCIVLFRMADYFKQSGYTKSKTEVKNLVGILDYCLNVERCRHDLIGVHFEEHENLKCEMMCDNCLHSRRIAKFNVVEPCLQIYKIIEEATAKETNITLTKLMDTWFKSCKALIKKAEAECIIGHLLLLGFLKEFKSYTAYSVNCYLKKSYDNIDVEEIVITMTGNGNLEKFLKVSTQRKELLRKRKLTQCDSLSKKIIVLE